MGGAKRYPSPDIDEVLMGFAEYIIGRACATRWLNPSYDVNKEIEA